MHNNLKRTEVKTLKTRTQNIPFSFPIHSMTLSPVVPILSMAAGQQAQGDDITL